MSIEKSAALLATLAKALAKRGNMIKNHVRYTAPYHVMAGKDKGFSLTSMLLDAAESNGAIGAKSLAKGYRKFQEGVSVADTALGAALRGSAKPGSLRYNLFTNTKGMVPVKKDALGRFRLANGASTKAHRFKDQFDLDADPTIYYRKMHRASVSAPLEGIASAVTTGLALTKADEIATGLQNNNNYTVEEMP